MNRSVIRQKRDGSSVLVNEKVKESLGHAVDLRVGEATFWVVPIPAWITSSLAAAGSLDRVVP